MRTTPVQSLGGRGTTRDCHGRWHIKGTPKRQQVPVGQSEVLVGLAEARPMVRISSQEQLERALSVPGVAELHLVGDGCFKLGSLPSDRCAVAHDAVTVEMDAGRVCALGQATVLAGGTSQVDAFGQSVILVADQATCHAYNEVVVLASDSTDVVAHDSVLVCATGDACVSVTDQASLVAQGNVVATSTSSGALSLGQEVLRLEV